MVDIKGLVTNKWTLAAAGAGGGYFVGKKYVKTNGGIYGALGGALAGYIAGRLLEPKRQLTELEYRAAAAQVAANPQTVLQGDGLDDYVDVDEWDEPVATVPPGASTYAQRVAQVEHDAAAAVRSPPRGDPANLDDLNSDWNAGGSLGGGLGADLDDQTLSALEEESRRGGGGNGRV